MVLNIIPVDKTTWFFPKARGLKNVQKVRTPLLNHQIQGTTKHPIKNFRQYIKTGALANTINTTVSTAAKHPFTCFFALQLKIMHLDRVFQIMCFTKLKLSYSFILQVVSLKLKSINPIFLGQ
jgi:hypothetical protein